MATRSRLEHQQYARDKIQTSQIINRLNKHTLSEEGDIMTSSQVLAAKILLNKVIPDEKYIELVADLKGSLNHKMSF